MTETKSVTDTVRGPMSKTVSRLRGLDDAEYAALKSEAKAAGLAVNIRRHKVRHAWNSVDIRPTKQDGRRWSAETFARVREFVVAHGFYDHGTGGGWFGENAEYVYRTGFDYLMIEDWVWLGRRDRGVEAG